VVLLICYRLLSLTWIELDILKGISGMDGLYEITPTQIKKMGGKKWLESRYKFASCIFSSITELESFILLCCENFDVLTFL